MDYAGYGYAALVAGGGVVGFVRKGSIMSLVSGLLFGGVSAYGSHLTSQNPRNCTVLLASSGALGLLMTFRSIRSKKYIPAGLVASLSILMVLRLAPRMMK